MNDDMPTPPRSARAARRAWQVPLVIAVWLGLIQWPVAPTGALDPSWQLLLSDAWRHGRQFGVEVLFTWGPFGFLFQEHVMPEVVPLKVPFEIVTKLLTALGLVALAAGLDLPRRVLFIVTTLSLGVIFPDALLTLVIVAIAGRCLHAPEVGPRQLTAGVACLAFLSLVKFTHFVLATAAVVVAASCALVGGRRTRALTVVVGFGLGVAGFWVAGGQHLANLPAFVTWGLDISGGYAQAMALDEPRQTFFLGAALLAVLAVAILGWGWRHRGSLEKIAVAVTLLTAVCVSWKHGFTRADMHVLVFHTVALFVSSALPVLARGATATWPLVTGIALAGTGFWWVAPDIFWQSPVWSGRRIVHSAERLVDLTAWRRELAVESAEQFKAWAFPRTSAVVGEHTIDLIDFEQGIILLNRLSYRPRPVPQSYAAYTPGLLRQNHQFIESDRAPEYLLVRGVAIDGRYSGQTESLLLAELPRRYQPVLEERGYQLLRRRPEQPDGEEVRTPLLDRAIVLGEWIDMPLEADRALWLEADPRLTNVGRLRSLLYKPPTLLLTTEDTQGTTRTSRLIPGIARAGFIVHPLLDDWDDLAAFVRGHGGRLARRLRLEAPNGEQHFWETIPLRIARVESLPVLPRHRLREVVERKVSNLQPESVPEDSLWRILEEGTALLHPPGEIVFHVDDGSQRLTGEYGIQPVAYTDGHATDGVEFVVSVAGAGGQDVVIHRRRLDPVRQPLDRGPQAFALELPQGRDRRVIIRTLMGATATWDWSYVGRLQFVP